MHYPVGSKPDTFITPAEKESKFCPGLTGKQKDLYEEFGQTRLNSRKVSVSLFSPCFLEEVLALSRTAGKELGVHLSDNLRDVLGEVGEKGRVRSLNVTMEWGFLHTHPRATNESLPATLHSPEDLFGDIIYSIGQRRATITEVIGTVCGESIEKSVIGFAGKKIFVNNSTELEAIRRTLKIIFTEQSDSMNRARELLRKYGISKATDFEVSVAPDKIQQIARQYKFKPEAENMLLLYFKTQLRKK